MACKITNLEAATTIGIDIGKNTFHLIGFDKKGAIVLRQKLTRKQVDSRLANMPPCLIGMEAVLERTISAGTSRHWAMMHG